MKPTQNKIKYIFILSIFFSAKSAFPFAIETTDSGAPIRWFIDSVPLTTDVDGTSTITNGTDLELLTRAISSWNLIDCSRLRLQQAATTSSEINLITRRTPSSSINGANDVVWIEDETWTYGSTVLGITQVLFDPNTGEIVEADIGLNGDTRWGNGTANSRDVESVIVHELGHLVGLQHVIKGNNAETAPTMSPAADPCLRSRTLSRDDMSGACYLYPNGNYTCTDKCDCPMILGGAGGGEFNLERLTCDGGSCKIPTQTTAQLGEPCGFATCTNGTTCTNFDERVGVHCLQDCPCPSGFQCLSSTNSNSGGKCLSQALIDGRNQTVETCLAKRATGAYAGPPVDSPFANCPPDLFSQSSDPDPQELRYPQSPTEIDCFCDSTPECDCDCDRDCNSEDGGCNATDPNTFWHLGLLMCYFFLPKKSNSKLKTHRKK